MRVYDAIVVGGGPGGATAARELARAGWTVLLIDAALFPRPKTCGGGVTVRAARLLPFPVDEVVEARSSCFRFAWLGRHAVRAQAASPFVYQVRRERFDHLLLQAALSAGAEALLGRRVRALREHEDAVTVELAPAEDREGGAGPTVVRARVVVGADGARGSVARAAGLAAGRRYVPAVEAEVPVPQHPPDALTFDFGLPRHGYAWVFPKQGAASLGVIAFRRPRAPLRQELDRYAALWGLGRLGGACSGAPLGCDGAVRAPASRRVALVGDAAGLADPLSGEGIYYAIRSAQLLAETLAPQRPSRPDLARYARRLEGELGPELRWARRLAGGFYAAPGAFRSLIRRRPGYADALVRLCRGEIGMAEVARRVARLSLGLGYGARCEVELAPEEQG